MDWKITEDRLSVRSPFISPEIDTDPDGFFTTGDRVAADGRQRFTLIGRADGVVKVGGNRVDLEAVRDALRQVSGVEDAVIVAVAGSSGRENDLYAVIQGQIDPEELKKNGPGADRAPCPAPQDPDRGADSDIRFWKIRAKGDPCAFRGGRIAAHPIKFIAFTAPVAPARPRRENAARAAAW